MPKGMFLFMVIALLVYCGFRIAALFTVAKVKTSSEVFRAKFFLLRSENRWLALENLVRSFVSERIAENNKFESQDLVKVSPQLWDKVRVCNNRMLMLPVLAALTLVTFPIFSCVLYYTPLTITPVIVNSIAQKVEVVQEDTLRLIATLTIFVVNVAFIVICAVIANKAISNIERTHLNSEPKSNGFGAMLFWFTLLVINCYWSVPFFAFLPEAFIMTFMFYATGMFYDEPDKYDATTRNIISGKKIKWFMMPIIAGLASFFFPANGWMSIAVVGATLFITAFLLTKQHGIHPMISIGRKVFIVTLTCFVLRNFAPYFLTDSYISLNINTFLMLAACFSVIGIYTIKSRHNKDIIVFDLSDYVSKIILLIKYKNQFELWVEQGMSGKDIAIAKQQSSRNISSQPRQRSLPAPPPPPKK
jgi:hypothetical protein